MEICYNHNRKLIQKINKPANRWDIFCNLSYINSVYREFPVGEKILERPRLIVFRNWNIHFVDSNDDCHQLWSFCTPAFLNPSPHQKIILHDICGNTMLIIQGANEYIWLEHLATCGNSGWGSELICSLSSYVKLIMPLHRQAIMTMEKVHFLQDDSF